MPNPRRRPRRVARSGRRPLSPFARVVLWAVAVGATLLAVKIGVLFYEVRGESGSKALNVARRLFEEVVSPDYVFRGRDRLNVLLIVEDITLDNRRQRVEGHSRSDTNIVIALDRVGRTMGVLSLPRDTLVNIPAGGEQGGWHKLNAAHAYGGPWLLVETIRENLHLDVQHYIKTNAVGFVKLVDLVDGVEIDVERAMHYDDTWQDFHVHLEPGLQHLDGKKAEGYVRWRKNNPRSKGGDGRSDPRGDLGRIERQQKVMEALLKKALSPRYLPRLRAIMREARQNIETDLTDRELASLAMFMSRFNPGGMQKATLPVEGGASVRILRQEAAPLLAGLFGGTFDEFAFLGGGSGPRRSLDPLPEPSPSPLRELQEPEDDPLEPDPIEDEKQGPTPEDENPPPEEAGSVDELPTTPEPPGDAPPPEDDRTWVAPPDEPAPEEPPAAETPDPEPAPEPEPA